MQMLSAAFFIGLRKSAYKIYHIKKDGNLFN